MDTGAVIGHRKVTVCFRRRVISFYPSEVQREELWIWACSEWLKEPSLCRTFTVSPHSCSVNGLKPRLLQVTLYFVHTCTAGVEHVQVSFCKLKIADWALLLWKILIEGDWCSQGQHLRSAWKQELQLIMKVLDDALWMENEKRRNPENLRSESTDPASRSALLSYLPPKWSSSAAWNKILRTTPTSKTNSQHLLKGNGSWWWY